MHSVACWNITLRQPNFLYRDKLHPHFCIHKWIVTANTGKTICLIIRSKLYRFKLYLQKEDKTWTFKPYFLKNKLVGKKNTKQHTKTHLDIYMAPNTIISEHQRESKIIQKSLDQIPELCRSVLKMSAHVSCKSSITVQPYSGQQQPNKWIIPVLTFTLILHEQPAWI